MYELNELIKKFESKDDGITQNEIYFITCELIDERKKHLEMIKIFVKVLKYYAEKPIFGKEAEEAISKYEEMMKVE